MRVVDQRDIQARGGKCAKYPISCLVYDMLLKTLHNPEHMVVLDVTYGQGRFYGAWRPKLLLASDVKIHQWVVEPDWFTKSPSWSVYKKVEKLGVVPDVVVVDPPWTQYIHRRRQQFNTVYGSPDTILEGGIRTAYRLKARYLLIHYKKYVEPEDWILVDAVEFHPVSRYINNLENQKSYFILLEHPEKAKSLYEEFFIMH